MERKIKIIGVCGSLRKESYNKKILALASELLPENMEMELVSIADIPLYNGDIDTPDVPERPKAVRDFRAAIKNVDGILIVSPEYNYSIPGTLKNSIDWASRGDDSPLIGKPISLMGASMGAWGTVRMQIAFQAIYMIMNMKQVRRPEILINNVHAKFDEKGNFTDENVKKNIRKNLENLRDLIIENQK